MYIVNLTPPGPAQSPSTASSPTAHAVLAGRNLGVPMVLGIGRKLDDPCPGAVPDADGTAGTVQAGPARPPGRAAGRPAAAAVAGAAEVGLLRTGRQPWDG